MFLRYFVWGISIQHLTVHILMALTEFEHVNLLGTMLKNGEINYEHAKHGCLLSQYMDEFIFSSFFYTQKTEVLCLIITWANLLYDKKIYACS